MAVVTMKTITTLLGLLILSSGSSLTGKEIITPDYLPTKQKSWELSVGLESGWRHDDFQWTIAGDYWGENPNILSDLDWTDLEIVTVGLNLDIKHRDVWRGKLAGSYGWIVDGQNRDSDYNYNNRKGEFSRSSADTDGHTTDIEVALGYDLPEIANRVTFTQWFGVSYHNQKLKDTNGIQLIDTEYGYKGPFGGLNSTYDAEWYGVTFGLDASIRLTDTARIILGARYELANYEADADWNLRPDFDGFYHDADGDGWRLSAAFEWAFAKNWLFQTKAGWSIFRTDAGTDLTYYSDNTASVTRLNEVRWDSFNVTAGVIFRF